MILYHPDAQAEFDAIFAAGGGMTRPDIVSGSDWGSTVMDKLNKFEVEALQDKDVAFGFDAYDVLKEIGALAKEARAEAGMSQLELQRASGIDQAEISRIETGSMERGTSVQMLVKLAHATGRRLIIGLSSREGDEVKAPRVITL